MASRLRRRIGAAATSLDERNGRRLSELMARGCSWRVITAWMLLLTGLATWSEVRAHVAPRWYIVPAGGHDRSWPRSVLGTAIREASRPARPHTVSTPVQSGTVTHTPPNEQVQQGDCSRRWQLNYLGAQLCGLAKLMRFRVSNVSSRLRAAGVRIRRRQANLRSADYCGRLRESSFPQPSRAVLRLQTPAAAAATPQ